MMDIKRELATSKVKRAFYILRQQNYIALHNFLCCGGCASAAITERIERRVEGGEVIKGGVYYHNQDFERACENGKLFIGYGGWFEGTAATGKAVCDALRKVGLSPEWDGDEHSRIEVQLW